MLTVHLYLGLLTVVAALTLVWRRSGRRITLYVLTLQILLGLYLMYVGLRVPMVHMLLALVAWGLYMAANVVERKQPQSKLVLIFTVTASLLVIAAAGIGSMAAHAAPAAS